MKKVLFASVAVLCLAMPAAASVEAATPQFSGSYVMTLINNCVQSGSSVSQTTALATFDAEAGTLKYKGYVADGDPLFLLGVTASGPYSNTKTTVTFNNITYKAIYGTVTGGVAQYASLIALIKSETGGPCGNQLTLQHT